MVKHSWAEAITACSRREVANQKSARIPLLDHIAVSSHREPIVGQSASNGTLIGSIRETAASPPFQLVNGRRPIHHLHL
ncbi:hypothetical protein T12_7458 [Trichinella patagoniensis]|uniref:Uncharacterized protein n=1 Tax=Trichinella patagoniensis TaxID=990121 RepID=A0A0V0ZPN3_9BILA|nr:hypothetical protein T12_7458 [Trichinella patagoniensis]